jgi:hypothetical protein
MPLSRGLSPMGNPLSDWLPVSGLSRRTATGLNRHYSQSGSRRPTTGHSRRRVAFRFAVIRKTRYRSHSRANFHVNDD